MSEFAIPSRTHRPSSSIERESTIVATEVLPEPGQTPLTAGATEGHFAVTADGAAAYTIPIQVPRGRSGIQPSLSLSYSSRGGNGLLGVGWALSGLSAITRCKKTYATDGEIGGVTYATDGAFCLDGQRLIDVTQGRPSGFLREFRTERDQFARIVMDSADSSGPTSFTVYSRNGEILRYGSNLGSALAGYQVIPQVAPPATVAEPKYGAYVKYGWALSEVSDRSKNYMTIDYELRDPCYLSGPAASVECAVEQRPKEIRYTYGARHSSANRAVRFFYELRPDTEKRYITGLLTVANSRLSMIEVRGPNPNTENTVRTYRLAYQTGKLSGRSLLRSVQECDRVGICLTPTEFEWEMGDPDFEKVDTGITDVGYFLPFYQGIETDLIPVPQGIMWSLIVSDINGDGKDDILYRKPSRNFAPGEWIFLDNFGKMNFQFGSKTVVNFDWYFRLAGEGGAPFGPPHLAGLPSQPLHSVDISQIIPRALDLDGDGRTDLAVPATEIKCIKPLSSTGIKLCYRTWLYFKYDGFSFKKMDLAASATDTKNLTGLNPSIVADTSDRAIFMRSPHMVVADINGDHLADPIHNLALWTDGGSISCDAKYVFSTNCDVVDPRTALLWAQGLTFPSGFDGTYTFLTDTGIGKGFFISPRKHSFEVYAADIDNSGRSGFLFPSVRVEDPGILVAKDEHWYRAGLQRRPGQIVTDLPLLSLPYADDSPEGFHYLFFDANGDGNTDALMIPNAGGEPKIAINAGSAGVSFNPSGFFAPASAVATPPDSWWPSVAFPAKDNRDSGIRVIDYNQDGRQDILDLGGTIMGNAPAIYQQTPDGLALLKFLDKLPGLSAVSPEIGSDGQVLSQVLDFDGDGLADFTTLEVSGTPTLGKSGEYKLNLYRRKGKKADMVTVIHDGLEHRVTGSYRIQYRPVDERSSVACTYPAYCVTRGMWVVSRHWQDTATEGAIEIHGKLGGTDDGYGEYDYQYFDGRWDLFGRGWLGFGRSTVTHLQSATTTRREFANDIRIGTHYPFAQLPTLIATSIDVPGEPSRQKRRTFKYSVISGDPTKLKSPYAVAATYELDMELQGMEDHTFETTTVYDSFGNITYRQHQNVGSTPFTEDFSAIYTNLTGPWLIGQLSDSDQTSKTGGESVTRSMHYDYDPATGSLVHIVRQPLDSTLSVDLTIMRNAEGQPVAQRVVDKGDPRWTIIAYNSVDGIEPVQVTNALGHTTGLVYNGGLGVATSFTDRNGITVRFQSDRLGRLRAILSPDGFEQRFHYTKEGSPLTIQAEGIDGVKQRVNFDRLGRAIQQSSTTLNGPWSSVRTSYDKRFAASPSSVSLPFFTAPTVYTRFEYDNLGRLTAQIHPDGSKATQEFNLLARTTQIDESGRRITFERDDLGRLAHTAEWLDDGMKVSTNFSYGPFGSLKSVGGTKGPTLQYTYDALGRLTDQIDPDMGTTHYSYNEFDELVFMRSASGDTTTLGRDLLGRVFIRSDKDGLAKFVWDTAINGIGKLASTSTANGVAVQNTYDVLSRPTQIKYLIEEKEYSLDITYDEAGRVRDLIYPAVGIEPRFTVRCTYGLNSEWIASGMPGGIEFWRAETRNAAGQLTAESFANGLRTIRYFDPKQLTLERLDTGNLLLLDETGSVQALRYKIKPDGDLSVRTDKLTKGGPQDEIYTYDSFDRLKEWLNPGSGNVTFQYDVLGNMFDRSTSGVDPETITFLHSGIDAGGNPVGPHAVTESSYGKFAYDKNGQQRTAPDKAVTFTALGLPSKIVRADGETTFTYDAFGGRVIKRSEGASTTYLGRLYERREIAGQTSHVFYVPGPERTVAQVVWQEDGTGAKTKKILYLHDDLIGSTSVVTDEKGGIVERFRYDPFGRRQDPDSPLAPALPPVSGVHLGFTGHEHDDELGLVNMQGRIYDARAMRFLSPDPFLADPRQGRSLNRYSYALNNPTRYIDPSGFESVESEMRDEPINDLRGGTFQSDPIDEIVIYGECADRCAARRLLASNPWDASLNAGLLSSDDTGSHGLASNPFTAWGASATSWAQFEGEVRSGDLLYRRREALENEADMQRFFIAAAVTGASFFIPPFVSVGMGVFGIVSIPSDSVGDPALGIIGGFAAVAALPRALGTAAKELPVLEISASRYPELAENIMHAQKAGRSDILTHGGIRAVNRDAALKEVPNLRGWSRDEYPFASSLEGGAGAWVGHIPKSQQNSQGALVKNFIKRHKIEPRKGKYRVKVVD